MKTREQIITDMCYTWRHDYGLTKPEPEHDEAEGIFDIIGVLQSGMTDKERTSLWNQMAQIFDNNIAPHMIFKIPDSRGICDND
jgi:hypothetical protein